MEVLATLASNSPLFPSCRPIQDLYNYRLSGLCAMHVYVNAIYEDHLQRSPSTTALATSQAQGDGGR